MFLYVISWILAILAGIYIIVVGYLFFNQKQMVFFPYSKLTATPQDMGIKYEDVEINIGNGETIHGWYLPSSDSSDNNVVLFCHGNAGNISNRLYTIQLFRTVDIPFLIFDYRGYGQSKGEISEENSYQDAQLCYRWLIEEKNYKGENITVFGRSLGGGVGLELSLREKVKGLIIESSFTSTGDLGQKLFPMFPIKWFLKYKYDSISKIKNIKCPVLVIHSNEDDLIPYFMGKKLFESAPEPKEFFDIFGGHNDREYLQNPDYINKIKSFITGDLSE